MGPMLYVYGTTPAPSAACAGRGVWREACIGGPQGVFVLLEVVHNALEPIKLTARLLYMGAHVVFIRLEVVSRLARGALREAAELDDLSALHFLLGSGEG